MNKIYQNLKRHMEKLCLECGPRQCGSAGEKMASDYIESEFRKLGYETFREEFSTIGWNCTEFSFRNVTKNRKIEFATAGYFSNSVDIEAPLVWLTGIELNKLDTMDLKGKLCFVEAHIISIGGGMNAVAELLDSYGAAGAVFVSSEHTAYMPSTKLPRSPLMKTMATVTVNQTAAYDLYANRNDIYRLKITAEKFDHVSCNVVARRNGGAKKGVIGAHYDTAPFIQGASDDASGTCGVIELARIFKDKYPDWSFDFCAFSAEEYIVDNYPEGSKDYVKRHKNEDIKWFVNLDGMGGIMADRVLEISHGENLPSFNVEASVTRNAVLSGDDKTFSQNGIPTVWLKEKLIYSLLHTELDNMDNVDIERMAQHTTDYVKIIDTLANCEKYN